MKFSAILTLAALATAVTAVDDCTASCRERCGWKKNTFGYCNFECISRCLGSNCPQYVAFHD